MSKSVNQGGLVLLPLHWG